MKILYLSCHSILEHDELRLFEELGYEYFSLGSYLDPQRPVDAIRPPLKTKVRSEWYDRAPDRNNIPKEFFDEFDVIIIMHVPEWIEANWERMKHKRVIWRTIGQSTPSVEHRLASFRRDGLEVVRYSTAEQKIEDNIGADALIRFYKDDNEFYGYNGLNRVAITFAQNMKVRNEFCNYETWEKVSQGLPMKVYGPNNENMGEKSGGFRTYDELKQIMRDSRVYFYTGTQPASYTLNFIEAMMTGIPVVAIGPKLADSLQIAGDVYEVHHILDQGVTGFYSDDVDTLRSYIQKLLDDPALAKRIGAAGREKAIQVFGKERIKEQWDTFLTS